MSKNFDKVKNYYDKGLWDKTRVKKSSRTLDYQRRIPGYYGRGVGRIMVKKAMLSQPMAGKTDDEIREAREKAITALEKEGCEIVNTLFTDEWYSKESMEERGVVQIPLCFLAKSLESMSKCHVAYFCKGWENARGCRIEHDAAVAYGLEIIYEV